MAGRTPRRTTNPGTTRTRMNRQKWTFLLVALAMIGGTAGLLEHTRTHQRLGKPGIRTASIPDSKRLEVFVPTNVLDYTAQVQPIDQGVLDGLPHDTSFGRCMFAAPDKSQILMNIVLMGTDRTSIHKPQFCLTGIGWNIDDAKSSSDTIRIESPHPYDLPVKKLIATREVQFKGQQTATKISGIYVYWFVADQQLTEDHWSRMWRMSTHLLATGELQRWAYVSYFSVCLPQDEAKTYDRMKKLIAASVPQFQLVAGVPVVPRVSPQAALH